MIAALRLRRRQAHLLGWAVSVFWRSLRGPVDDVERVAYARAVVQFTADVAARHRYAGWAVEELERARQSLARLEGWSGS